MEQRIRPDLATKVVSVRKLLAGSLEHHGRLTYASSLGAEAIVLTDLILTHLPQIDVFTLDTGRLPEETHDLLEQLQTRYQQRIRVIYPEAGPVERLVAFQGVNGFRGSVPARLGCCQVRKLQPFRKAIAGFSAWITGVRRAQSAERSRMDSVEWDGQHGLYKISPLLDWSEADVWTYIRSRGLPYNSLHDQGYPSIGCAPCTRAILPGEDLRAGRWWWERSGPRECGLHERTTTRRTAAVLG
ncbi:MAG: phosphoadenylyl-sulfate reductase [Gammaproteobacteria bacterium]|nr:phosphoadenylyl-sulfate reductase [Gammaproteobacteria bacterium]